jgi:hypothetical protein
MFFLRKINANIRFLCSFFKRKISKKLFLFIICTSYVLAYGYLSEKSALDEFACEDCGYHEDDPRFFKCEIGYGRGYKGDSNSYDHLGNVRRIKIETDNLALRAYNNDQVVNTESMSIFSGCSFVFGDGLNADETLPFIYSQISGRKSLNLGTSGGGLHSVHRLVDLLTFDELGGDKKTNFYYVFIPDHLNRWHQRASYLSWASPSDPSYEMVNFEAVYAGPTCKSFSYKIKQFFNEINFNDFGLNLLNFIYPSDNFSDEELDSFVGGVVSLNQKISKKKPNLNFHFVFHPLAGPLDGYKHLLNEKLRKAGISTLFFNNFFPNQIEFKVLQLKDKHPSGIANKLLAERFVDFEKNK